MYKTFILLIINLAILSTIAGTGVNPTLEIVSLIPNPANGACRYVGNVQLSVSGAVLSLNWTEVPGAVSYKVYSSADPEAWFSEDTSGVFDGTSWVAPVNGTRRFYYVTSLAADVPSNFVFVPGGVFSMGDTQGGGLSNELPVHSVSLSSFYMGKYEVTQSEWQAVMGSNPASPGYGIGDNYPVNQVSWYNILVYCNLRSLSEGLTPVYMISGSTNPATWGAVLTASNTTWNAALCNWNANGYRLPTEAEWEYAARGATSNPDFLYSGGNDINPLAWYSGNNSPDGAKPIGTKAPNGLGLFDMSGNVWEWCWDWYFASYYDSSPSGNPTGPASGSNRVARGGYWGSSASFCRVARRSGNIPNSSNYFTGFRLCRSDL
ncbi:MAG: SUMF1/EgtB/PvdO family nonheme iron enzyme [Candidatus Cloacimonetes bacterium]|nr:SUMF1/EgtB/PvdO family nonheme iron enzyme [Candidatus Cloacimonadota bacterium]